MATMPNGMTTGSGDVQEHEDDGEFAIREPALLREMAEFYGHRPCVPLGGSPTLREMSQGECADLSVALAGAADEIERLRAVLTEVAKGEGAFSRDHLTHATNTIESMKQIALDALSN